MKVNVLAFVLILFATGLFAGRVYDIDDAIKRNLVTVNITGVSDKNTSAEHSSHHGACISVTLRNNTSSQFTVSFESGRLLECLDTGVQTMLLTKSSNILMQPNRTSHRRLFAMCSQKNKEAPSGNKKFRVGKMAKESLLGLAKLIEKKNYQNRVAQDAVWALTDNKPIDKMKNGNAMEKELFIYVSMAKKKEAELHTTQSSKISFITNFSEVGAVSVRVFDSNGKMIKTLTNTLQAETGSKEYVYWLHNTDFSPGTYKVVLFYNGVAKMEEPFEF